MDDTSILKLPLLQPSQAQKHVTVNEALMRIDAMVQLVLLSRTLATPPALVADGACYSVPIGAVNAWSGHDGELAIGGNGGWSFVLPKAGWRAWVIDEGMGATHDGVDWQRGMASLTVSGAGTRIGVQQIDHLLGVGATSATAVVIPSHAMMIGVTARVTQAITGTLASWQLGNTGSPDRFGSGLGLGQGSWAKGVLSQPLTYYAPSGLELTATGGDFAGGTVRIAAHYLELTLPSL